jgi:glucose-1-phosphate cytidylyltransferase
VKRFVEKPIINDCWINAGFFVFGRDVFDHWRGSNLETDVLPALAGKGSLFAYRHNGFWKSMDTSKDQQEMEQVHSGNGTAAPWSYRRSAAAASS